MSLAIFGGELPTFRPVAADGSGTLPDLSRRVLLADSGMGGLSVLREVRKALPEVGLLYLADAHAFPYGDWDEAALREHLVRLLVRLAKDWHVSAVVVACNTASTIVLPQLRAALTVPVVGTVPAIKPAAAATRSGLIGVLATPGTAAREYTAALIAEFAGKSHVKLVGARRLAQLAEDKLAGRHVDLTVLSDEIAPCFVCEGRRRTDVVVLGCTHYPLLLDELREVAPWPVQFIDPAAAIARRLRSVLAGGAVSTCADTVFLRSV
ncbi:glutamate racemase [Polycladidibacter hongkongensis]|uniref:glutamate racemase n=1 Tax=Polycladidibacter hongkongensis TaxID=1647556 RepID=UPI0009EBAB14|nr:glutamate racemase [Pseudovibrio hongkongensis]